MRNRKSGGNHTPLHAAIQVGNVDSVRTVIQEHPEQVHDIHQGQTPLFSAVERLVGRTTPSGRVLVPGIPFEIIQLLVQAGVNLNHQDANGDTVLHTIVWRLLNSQPNAAIHASRMYDAAVLFVNAGADVDTLRNNAGRTVMDIVRIPEFQTRPIRTRLYSALTALTRNGLWVFNTQSGLPKKLPKNITRLMLPSYLLPANDPVLRKPYTSIMKGGKQTRKGNKGRN